MKLKTRTDYRKRRHLRVRKKIKGTADRPRMCVFISSAHIYVQFIDDKAEATLAAVSTLDKDMAGPKNRSGLEAAKALGVQAAKTASAKGIKSVVFDRAGHPFTGRVKVLADAAREAGLAF